MKKAVLLIVTAAAVISLSGCAGRENEKLSDVTDGMAGAEPIESVLDSSGTETVANTDEEAEKPSDEIPDNGGIETDGEEHSHILIAYFTWAENTYVENPEAVDVDATTSASVLPPGNAAKMAGWIQEEVGGDLFSIVVTQSYSSDYDECLDRAADEKADNARPELLYHVENMEDYDIVFLGFPNWWYTVPMAIHTFLEEYDFSGKTIVPFVTHGTGGLASTITDITADLPDSVTILEPIGVYRPEVDSSEQRVKEWVAGLDINL